MDTEEWSIGALARAAGVSVRTLRYYDQIGLLVASGRSAGDHRRYLPGDVHRLYRILALRSLGFTLEAIGSMVDGDQSRALVDIVREQHDRVLRDLDQGARLRRRLDTLLTTLAQADEPTPEDLLRTMELITIQEVSPAWITGLLRRGGHLPSGTVADCRLRSLPSRVSSVDQLMLTYSADAPGGLPASMIYKRNGSPAWAVQAGAEEVRFYRTVTGLPDHPDLVPRCFAALHEAVTGDSHLLLEDLTQTHQAAGHVPPDATIDAAVDTLARLHAFWWDHPLLREGIFPLLDWNGDSTRYEEYQIHRGRSWKRLSTQAEAGLPGEIRELVQGVFDGLPAHWDMYLSDRVSGRRNLTLLHGDSYFANFLTPRPGVAGPTYLADWQCPTGNIGALDLVNLCATFWTREHRHENDREQGVLRRYHRRLLDHGVTGYAWDQLLDDYRCGLVYWLLVPIQDAHGGAAREYWWPKLRCLADAYQDWNAGKLLDAADRRR